jgi:hypothetical protein
MIKRIIISLLLSSYLVTASAQRITHTFNNVTMSDALKFVQSYAGKYQITFIFNELEDFRVTAELKNSTVPDAIRQIIGLYPIRMTEDENKNIYVECISKVERRYKGRIMDEMGRPAEYANITLLSPTDSAIIGNGVSNEDGYFVIPCEAQRVIVKISYVGYKTIHRIFVSSNMGTIRLQPDNNMLKGVVVKGERSQYQTKGNAIVTNVAGTILSKLHSTNDVLMQVPGVVVSPDGSLSAFGLGKPVYYVNNRKVQNSDEIKRLSPKDIASIELIRNPGAQYDADENAIIKITTLKRDDGWVLRAEADAEMNDVLSSDGSVDVGLKQSKLNTSAHIEYEDDHKNYYQPQIFEFVTDGAVYKYDLTHQHSRSSQRIPDWATNIDYEFNKHQIVGASYEGHHNRWLSPSDQILVYLKNGEEMQRTTTESNYHNTLNYVHLNSFYNAEWNKRLHSQLNLDYVGNTSDYWQNVEETSSGEKLSTFSKSNGHFNIFAGKLAFDYTISKHIMLLWGIESEYVKGHGTLESGNSSISSSDFLEKEHKHAFYLEERAGWGNWLFHVGMRYESLMADYVDKLSLDKNSHRHYRNLFPSLDLTYSHGGWTNSLSFSSRTNRPSFRQLSNYTYYANEFMYQHGNPKLQPTTLYITEWNTGYKFVNASVSYTYKRNLIASDLYTEDKNSQQLILSSFSNFSHAQVIAANINLQHTYKWWRPSLRIGVVHPFFDCKYMGEPYSYGKTNFYILANQYFDLPKSWLFNIYYYYNSGGAQNNIELSPFQTLNISIQKSFCRKRLSIVLGANDLFRKMKLNENTYIRNLHFWQIEDDKYRNVSISIVYYLNQLKTKYRGKSAATEDINRL